MSETTLLGTTQEQDFSLGVETAVTPARLVPGYSWQVEDALFNADTSLSEEYDANIQLSGPDGSNVDMSIEPLYGEFTHDPATGFLKKASPFNAAGFIVRASMGRDERVIEHHLRASQYPVYKYNDYAIFEPGSVSRHICDNIEFMTQDKTPGAGTQLLWTTYDRTYNAEVGVPNPNLFTRMMDISCTTFNGGSGHRYPSTLITPRHMIGAAHATFGTNSYAVFRAPSGNFYRRKVIAIKRVPSIYDCVVLLLESPVPEIEPAYMLPPNWAEYLPWLWNTGYPIGRVKAQYMNALALPILVRLGNVGYESGTGGNANPIYGDQARMRVMMLRAVNKICLFMNTPALGTFLNNSAEYLFREESASIYTSPYSPTMGASVGWPTTKFKPWGTIISGGDSGSPAFVPIATDTGLKPVLLGHQYTALHQGPIFNAHADIEKIINDWRITYSDTNTYPLSIVDLTRFKRYNLFNPTF